MSRSSSTQTLIRQKTAVSTADIDFLKREARRKVKNQLIFVNLSHKLGVPQALDYIQRQRKTPNNGEIMHHILTEWRLEKIAEGQTGGDDGVASAEEVLAALRYCAQNHDSSEVFAGSIDYLLRVVDRGLPRSGSMSQLNQNWFSSIFRSKRNSQD